MDANDPASTPLEQGGAPAPAPEEPRGTRKRAAAKSSGIEGLPMLEALEVVARGRARAGTGTKSGLWAFSKALMAKASEDKEVFALVVTIYLDLLRGENPLAGTGYPIPPACPAGLENYLSLLRAITGAQRGDTAVVAAVKKILATVKKTTK